jgi:hypothetical protein
MPSIRVDRSFVRWARVLSCVAVLAPAGAYASSPRDFLVGPVALAPGETMVVSAANVLAAPSCAEAATVAFIDHGTPSRPPSGSGVAVRDVRRLTLGSARLGPAKSAQVVVGAGSVATTKTIQVHVETGPLVLGTDPCVSIGATLVRVDGRRETIDGVQMADAFSIVRPSSEAICIGVADCDALLTVCEIAGPDHCEFTCHIVDEGEGCILGST